MPEGFLLLNSRLSSNDVKEIRAALKAAYQRGREDAAKAVEYAMDDYYEGDHRWSPMERATIAAARGDGE